MTELNPAMAPSLTNGLSQASPGPAASTPTAIGSGTDNSVYFTIPVKTRATMI